ncbi:hypothetical protein Tdes44962_MAKER03696 [Teratosphaeria destructans]|uniref:Uncharacterized protein n=1 Tax=Teratosphaeria destructans TaxID=418781 RepID=A0A9W7W0V2_9PEZI|nr:hypothetical protein Tdes44962_MAKER03696 [Teratosphaeria destructans]
MDFCEPLNFLTTKSFSPSHGIQPARSALIGPILRYLPDLYPNDSKHAAELFQGRVLVVRALGKNSPLSKRMLAYPDGLPDGLPGGLPEAGDISFIRGPSRDDLLTVYPMQKVQLARSPVVQRYLAQMAGEGVRNEGSQQVRNCEEDFS